MPSFIEFISVELLSTKDALHHSWLRKCQHCIELIGLIGLINPILSGDDLLDTKSHDDQFLFGVASWWFHKSTTPYEMGWFLLVLTSMACRSKRSLMVSLVALLAYL